MSRTIVSVCNQALTALGARLISTIDEGTKAADYCIANFDDALDEVLRMHEWNCAIARQELAQLETAPDFGWDYQYTLPTDPYCLMALDINSDPSYEFAVEGRLLLTDADAVDLRYLKRVTDLSELDPLCARAVALNLAYKLAYPLMQSRKLKDEIFAELQEIISIASAASRKEDSQITESELDYDWLNSRL